MTTYRLISRLFFATALFAAVSCGGGAKTNEEAKEEESLPEDIVEMRADQKKLANIELGSIEMRSLNSTLKVSGLVGVAPENLATVCMPMGGFVKSTSLMPGSFVSKGQTLAVIENQDFEVLIKGGEENIVKGYDQDKGLSYYKLYFREEK